MHCFSVIVFLFFVSCVCVYHVSSSETSSESAQSKKIGQATIGDCKLVLSDSQDSQEIAEGRKFKCEYPNAIDEILLVEHFQHLYLDFKVKSKTTGKPISVHQTLLKIYNTKNQQEFYAVATNTGKQYSAHISFADIADDFYGSSGEYKLELIIGDALIQNPFSWKVAALNVTFSNETSSQPESPFAAKPEIAHKFRIPEKRPPQTISFAFTMAVLSPFLVLFIGLFKVGANISNFPTGGLSFIYALGFQACLAGIFALFALFWLKLNMVQTLIYLGLLSLPTLFFSHQALNQLAASSTKAKTE